MTKQEIPQLSIGVVNDVTYSGDYVTTSGMVWVIPLCCNNYHFKIELKEGIIIKS